MKSLVSSVTHMGTDASLASSKHGLVMLISTALNKALQELHAIPDTPHRTSASFSDHFSNNYGNAKAYFISDRT